MVEVKVCPEAPNKVHDRLAKSFLERAYLYYEFISKQPRQFPKPPPPPCRAGPPPSNLESVHAHAMCHHGLN